MTKKLFTAVALMAVLLLSCGAAFAAQPAYVIDINGDVIWLTPPVNLEKAAPPTGYTVDINGEVIWDQSVLNQTSVSINELPAFKCDANGDIIWENLKVEYGNPFPAYKVSINGDVIWENLALTGING